jgi:hypothetical protein
MRNLLSMLALATLLGGLAAGAGAQSAAQKNARGLPFDVYIRLQQGMSEGELLLRAGEPDSQSVENTRHDIVKTYYYFPTSSDPWITTIRLQGGRIVNLERIKKF